MAITELTDDLNIVAALDDEPNDTGGLTPAQLKAKFDEAGNKIKTYINGGLIPDVEAAIDEKAVHNGNVPAGGTTGQVLLKDSDSDYDAVWGVPGDSAATPNMVMTRDASGRAQVTAPVDDADIATKGYVEPFKGLSQKNLVNILRLKLQQALAASDIDAWSDLFVDESLLDMANSFGVQVSGGSLGGVVSIGSTGSGSPQDFGKTTGYEYFGQTFTTPENTTGLTGLSITVRLAQHGGAYDFIYAYIYAVSGGVPTGSVLYTATSPVSGGSMTGELSNQTFNFTGLSLSANSQYAIVFKRGAPLNDTQYFSIGYDSYGSYADGNYIMYYSSTWGSGGSDLYFTLTYAFTGHSAKWTVVIPTEALISAAICAEQNEGTGSIRWYLSDDGTDWIEITSLDTLQNVAFTTASVYLKCVLTGNATVDAVAYGGY